MNQKNGGTAFFSSEFFVLPGAQMAMMVTGNTGAPGQPGTYNPGALAEGILMRALLEEGTISAIPPLVANTVPPAATAPEIADAAGIYGNYNEPLQVIVQPDDSFVVNRWAGNAWQPMNDGATFRYRTDGWWWSNTETKARYRFDIVSGTDGEGNPFSYRYLMARGAFFGAGFQDTTLPKGQQLAPLPALNETWQARLNSTWVAINESPDSIPTTLSGKPFAKVSELPELPGYILLSSSGDDRGVAEYQLLVPLADDRGGMSVRIPLNMGRDLYEIHFATANESTTMTIGSMIYVPA